MAEFTKEQLIAEVHYNLEHCFCSEKTKRLMEIALAALTDGMEQEPVAWLLSGGGAKNNVSFDSGNAYADPLREVTPLYTAPPAPVALTSGYSDFEEIWSSSTHPLTQDDEMKDFAWDIWNACRAAMLQGKSVKQPSSIKTSDCAGKGEDIKQASSNEPVSQRDEFPEGWVAVPADMTPEQMRAVQLNSELGAYASVNLSGAYSLFREFWDVAIAAAPQQEA